MKEMEISKNILNFQDIRARKIGSPFESLYLEKKARCPIYQFWF